MNSQDKLALLADKALKDFKAGKTKPFFWKSLELF
jgi:hypothetical protein